MPSYTFTGEYIAKIQDQFVIDKRQKLDASYRRKLGKKLDFTLTKLSCLRSCFEETETVKAVILTYMTACT